MPIKILVVSNYRGTHQSRPEAELFIALKAKGFIITIMTFEDADYMNRFQEHGIKVINCHPNRKYDSQAIKAIRTELQNGGYHILQLFNNKAITNGIRAAYGLNVKVVIYRGAAANMAWYNPLNYFKFYHPRIDMVICNSEEIQEKFINNPFFNATKSITILKGHDPKWYADVQAYNIREELSISKDHLIFVTIANNRKVKGIRILMKALKDLDSNLKASFLLVGSGMENATFRSLAKRSNIAKDIHFLDFRKDALSIVAASDVFILPSIGSEALTKSVIEAMSLGIPALISNLPGNKPLVDDGINGMIFKNGNAKALRDHIIHLSENREKLNAMSLKAKEKILKDIHINETISAYMNLYNRIVS